MSHNMYNCILTRLLLRTFTTGPGVPSTIIDDLLSEERISSITGLGRTKHREGCHCLTVKHEVLNMGRRVTNVG